MLLLLLYSPVLIFLPILLLGGIIFVVVPGGFIIVLAAAAYFLSVAFIGLVGLAAKGWRQAVGASRRRIMASSARRRPAQQTLSTGPRAALEAPVTAGSRSDGPIGLALNFAPPSSVTGRRQPRRALDAAPAEQAADQSRAA